MAKKKASGGSAKKAGREVLVVASKVKAYVKSKNMNTSADAIEALSARVYEVIDAGTSRTSENGRKTLKPYDL